MCQYKMPETSIPPPPAPVVRQHKPVSEALLNEKVINITSYADKVRIQCSTYSTNSICNLLASAMRQSSIGLTTMHTS